MQLLLKSEIALQGLAEPFVVLTLVLILAQRHQETKRPQTLHLKLTRSGRPTLLFAGSSVGLSLSYYNYNYIYIFIFCIKVWFWTLDNNLIHPPQLLSCRKWCLLSCLALWQVRSFAHHLSRALWFSTAMVVMQMARHSPIGPSPLQVLDHSVFSELLTLFYTCEFNTSPAVHWRILESMVIVLINPFNLAQYILHWLIDCGWMSLLKWQANTLLSADSFLFIPMWGVACQKTWTSDDFGMHYLSVINVRRRDCLLSSSFVSFFS